MKTGLCFLIAAAGLLPSANFGHAAEATALKDQVTIEVESVGLHPGMDPGMYICAQGHLHIKALVRNRSSVPLAGIKVAGKAFDASGVLLGTATASPKGAVLGPTQEAEVNLEFLTVTGSNIDHVKRHEETVMDASLAY